MKFKEGGISRNNAGKGEAKKILKHDMLKGKSSGKNISR